jgi:putative two-component system hydrogenase maturation factor HypX/HoxX
MSEMKVLVLKGSHRNWSNGINLNVIEAAASPAEEGWRNILAINEVVKAVHGMTDKIIISAVQTNAGAGGVYMALAADFCFAKTGIVLNPHYKNMGLFGS